MQSIINQNELYKECNVGYGYRDEKQSINKKLKKYLGLTNRPKIT